MKGCVLAGRYVFANDEAKNARLRHKQQALESKVMMPQGSDGPNQN
jgi:hypothetical protein